MSVASVLSEISARVVKMALFITNLNLTEFNLVANTAVSPENCNRQNAQSSRETETIRRRYRVASWDRCVT